MKHLWTVLIAAALFGPVDAKAEKFDLSTLTCKQFFAYNKENLSLLLTWMEGYYADQDADPVVDFAKLTAQGTKLAEACKADPSKDIISVAEKIYEAK